jgi:hypothetical protein
MMDNAPKIDVFDDGVTVELPNRGGVIDLEVEQSNLFEYVEDAVKRVFEAGSGGTSVALHTRLLEDEVIVILPYGRTIQLYSGQLNLFQEIGNALRKVFKEGQFYRWSL